MKKYLTYLLLTLVVFCGVPHRALAQIYDEDGLYVDTIFHDHVNRQTEDFVRASLVITSPGDVLYSTLGHACLHMECPTYDMDFYFSYESESVQRKIWTFLKGDLKMGLFAIPADEFLTPYMQEGREVKEYKLNLTPAQEGELWRVLDEHVAEGANLPYDYMARGCAKSVVNVLREAVGNNAIVYAKWPDKYPRYTIRELVQMAITEAKDTGQLSPKSAYWNAFFMYALIGSEGEKHYPCEKKLIIPNDLVEVWQQASLNGQPLLEKEAKILCQAQEKHFSRCWISPMAVALMLLIIAILGCALDWRWTEWVVLVVVSVIGALMTYLLVFSTLPCTTWNWLIIPFNILPILAWHWRRYWPLPYAGVIAIWTITMAVWPHKIVDSAYLILALAWIVTLFRPYIRNKISNIKILMKPK